jgi:hypothetical protein
MIPAAPSFINTRREQEIYLPAPPQCGLDETLEHHVATRNFFAWIYNIPLTGKALGPSLIALLDWVNTYRPADQERNRADVISYAESQKYLDFRECVDHALAIMCLAEAIHEESLWIDAYAHCVGLYHRGLRHSLEYEVRPRSFNQRILLTLV